MNDNHIEVRITRWVGTMLRGERDPEEVGLTLTAVFWKPFYWLGVAVVGLFEKGRALAFRAPRPVLWRSIVEERN